jgi:hypothetical protein
MMYLGMGDPQKFLWEILWDDNFRKNVQTEIREMAKEMEAATEKYGPFDPLQLAQCMLFQGKTRPEHVDSCVHWLKTEESLQKMGVCG